jgi:ubiquinone/menaquinone biosynthesis C-methylase UbiE
MPFNNVNYLLRWLREHAYRFLSPFDYMMRAINGKGDFPPMHLRRHVGSLRDFEKSGTEFMVYLKLFCELKPQERMLDIGCGCGLVSLFLLDYIDSHGAYNGMDIHKPSIKWCQKKISTKHPQFNFIHIDVKNRLYNPDGMHTAEDYSFPFKDNSVDVILLKSVFTHMMPNEIDNYVKEISRLLSDEGRCLATFFLLNTEYEEYSKKGLNKLAFIYGDEHCRYMRKGSPESAVAYGESYILDFLRHHGLKLNRPVIYGTWSGRKDGISHQDMLLLEKG